MGLFLTLLSSIFYYLSFPPYTSGYAAFLSLTPFLFALSKTQSFKSAAYLGALWGFVLSIMLSIPLYNALVTEYELSIFYSTLLIIISVYIPYGIIYGIFGLSFKYFFIKTGVFIPILTASLWLLIDYIMSITPFFMPWNFAGYSQTFNIFIQICDISGIYGVTFLVVIINSIIVSIFYFEKKYKKVLIFTMLLLLSSSIIYGHIRKNSINQLLANSYNKKISASVIQGNFNSREKWDSRNTSAIINTYISMTKQIISGTNIIVWPETVLNSNDKENLKITTGISSFLKTDQLLIAGATRNDTEKQVFNSIFTTNNSGLIHIYDKKILFPFTETSFAGMSSGNFMDSPSVFTHGKTKSVYKADIADIGYTICFESIYPDYVRRIKKSGASVLINVANDSWFGNTNEPYMHLYSSIIRGIENRIYVIRSSNNGISAIISPTGDILSSIELNSRDTITSAISPIKIQSVYSETGDWIIALAILVIIIFLVYTKKETN